MIQDIQKRFELPVLKGAGYSDSYAVFLRTIIHLRLFGIAFDQLKHLWKLEWAIMRLLHADSTGLPTWFLGSCTVTTQLSSRLLLSRFDIGVALPSGSIQLGLDFAPPTKTSDLFTSTEMGEDVLYTINLYLKEHALRAELPTVQSAIRHARLLTH
ncbi:MAG: hypothetical protein PHR35_13565 [Kiritimatiellae bacterium]|nr:hypothetical protein [Kiritimatiellia bacterium]